MNGKLNGKMNRKAIELGRAACLAIVVLGAVIVAGCTPSMTYPAYPGAPKADPSMQPMPSLMADAIKFAHQQLSPNSEIVIDLPAMTPKQVWRQVLKSCAPCRPMTPSDKVVWSVRQVKLSGGKAEVDVVYPAEGIYRLATVHFTGATGQPFYPSQLQFWLVPVTAPVCNTPEAVIADPLGALEPR